MTNRVGLNFEFAHQLLMNLNFVFSKSMNLNFVFSKSMNLNLNLIFLNLSLNFKIRKKDEWIQP